MLQNTPYYWGSVRKVVESFGALFSDLHIIRYNSDNTPYQTLMIPISYGPKEKWLVRNTQNPMPGVNDSTEMQLPRMSYEMTSWTYDAQRQLTQTGRTVALVNADNRVLKTQFNPAPYNLGFTLHVMSKNVEDGLMIIEQILPFFTPEYTITVYDMPELGLSKDLVIVHSGDVQHEDNWEGTFQERRIITWSMNFTVKAFIYPPVKVKKIILESDLYFHVDAGKDIVGALPAMATIPDPANATAANVKQVRTILSDTSVLVVSDVLSTELSGGQTQIFPITVLNTNNRNFTATVPITSQTTNDSYVINLGAGTFQYTAGLAVRTSQETLSVNIVSVADITRKVTLTLVINP